MRREATHSLYTLRFTLYTLYTPLWPRAFPLPVADEGKAQCVPWSIIDEGVRTEESIGYHKRGNR